MRGQHFGPHVFVLRQNGGDEAADLVGAIGILCIGGLRLGPLHGLHIAAAPACHHFRAADQHARVDAERIADEAEDDDRANAEAAAGATERQAETAATTAVAFTAPVLDIVRLAEIFPFHPNCLPEK